MRDLAAIYRDVDRLGRRLEEAEALGQGEPHSAVERAALLCLIGRLDQLEAELEDWGKKLGLLPPDETSGGPDRCTR